MARGGRTHMSLESSTAARDQPHNETPANDAIEDLYHAANTSTSLHDYLRRSDDIEENILGALYDADTYMAYDDIKNATWDNDEAVRDALGRLEEAGLVTHAPWAQRSTNRREEDGEKYMLNITRFSQHSPERRLNHLDQLLSAPGDSLQIYDDLASADTSPERADTPDGYSTRNIPLRAMEEQYDDADVAAAVGTLVDAGVLTRTIMSPGDVADAMEEGYEPSTGDASRDAVLAQALSGPAVRANDSVYTEILTEAREKINN